MVISMQAIREQAIGWDVSSWCPRLNFWLEHTCKKIDGAKVLELGAGSGALSSWLADKGADTFATDVCPSPACQYMNATSIPYRDHFDIIVFKSMLGALGTFSEQQRAMLEIWLALKPGGELWFAENLAASPLHRLARRKLVPWGQIWRYVRLAEMEYFLGVFSRFELETSGLLACAGRSEGQRALLAKVDRVLGPLVPREWHYIVSGIGVK